METRKLYYEDSHLTEFSARVLSCHPSDGRWEVVLDATAFYPEGGGQPCDVGMLATARVLDVQERQGTLIHFCHAPLEVGAEVTGRIDYSRRFRLMQQHSGEHIVSGIINRRYGYHNVGFHMASETMVIDFDGVIPGSELAGIEMEANRAVWANLPVSCRYPQPEELAAMTYRSKKALQWPVRIVEIPGVDVCACCGTHVQATGEIGIIKIFSAVPCRGGTRLEMACGYHALTLLDLAFSQNRLVSQAFSAKWPETGAAAKRMVEALEEERGQKAALWKRIFLSIAGNYEGQGDVLHFEPGLNPTQTRELADAIADTCNGIAAVFSGSDGDGYSYALVSRQGDLRPLGREMTARLSGRGGGKPNYQQGKVPARKEEIENFFRELREGNPLPYGYR